MTRPRSAASGYRASRWRTRPAAARRTITRFIRIGPGAELAPQTGRAELQPAGEALRQRAGVAPLGRGHERPELEAGLRVGIDGQPGLGQGADVVHQPGRQSSRR